MLITNEEDFLGSEDDDAFSGREEVVEVAGALSEVFGILWILWLWCSRLYSFRNLWRILHRLLV